MMSLAQPEESGQLIRLRDWCSLSYRYQSLVIVVLVCRLLAANAAATSMGNMQVTFEWLQLFQLSISLHRPLAAAAIFATRHGAHKLNLT